MQQAYVSAYQHLDAFEGRARFSTWMTRIAINEAYARLRKRHRNEPAPWEDDDAMADEPEAAGPSPEQIAARREMQALLERAVDTLSVPNRTVFVLRSVAGPVDRRDRRLPEDLRGGGEDAAAPGQRRAAAVAGRGDRRQRARGLPLLPPALRRRRRPRHGAHHPLSDGPPLTASPLQARACTAPPGPSGRGSVIPSCPSRRGRGHGLDEAADGSLRRGLVWGAILAAAPRRSARGRRQSRRAQRARVRLRRPRRAALRRRDRERGRRRHVGLGRQGLAATGRRRPAGAHLPGGSRRRRVARLPLRRLPRALRRRHRRREPRRGAGACSPTPGRGTGRAGPK